VVIRVFGVVMVAAYSGFSLDALLGSTFLVCISTPFDMIGVASGAFSGSFRCGAVFSLSDA